MKPYNLFLATIISSSLFSTGCRRFDSPSEIIESATPADSVLYYLSIMQGSDVNSQLLQEYDSTFEDAKREYLEGLGEGLKLARDKSDAKVKGLLDGLRMANEIRKFEEKYDSPMNPDIYMTGVRFELNGESGIPVDSARMYFYRLMNDFQGKLDGTTSRRNGKRYFNDEDANTPSEP